jgi:hypothetical protein
MKNYLILPLVLFLSACGSAQIESVKPIEVKTIEISRPAPIVPPVDQLRLRPVSWIIITPDNIEEQFAKLQKGELVLFAVTADGYQNIALNLSDIRALIEQQNRVIAVYKKQYK